MTEPEKTDLKKAGAYRARRGQFRALTVPPTRYLMVDGHGDPNTDPSYAAALAALYPVAYALKFASKASGYDYVVPPLEGLWWAEHMASFTDARDKTVWDWTMMLAVPDWLGEHDVTAAVAAVRAKKTPPARLDDVHVSVLDEGLCVQTLYIGTSARSTRKGRYWWRCTVSSSRRRDWRWPHATTRSISAIRVGRHRRSSAQACGSRCARPESDPR